MKTTTVGSAEQSDARRHHAGVPSDLDERLDRIKTRRVADTKREVIAGIGHTARFVGGADRPTGARERPRLAGRKRDRFRGSKPRC